MRTKWKIYIAIWLVVALLNVVAWNSKAFCDWYIFHVFPLWVNTYGRLTGLVPFSVGEIMIVAGVILVVAALLVGLTGVILKAIGLAVAKSMKRPMKECEFAIAYGLFWEKARALIAAFYRGVAWIVVVVALVMTLNCFILYHASTFSEKYFGEDKGEYTYEDLVTLRNFVVEKCNSLSEQIPRKADGTIVYPGDMTKVAKQTMKKLGETYDGLGGYYPSPKPLAGSDFLSQQYMCGYYFPFSMEANYNSAMYVMNKPSTFCHELAHLKGYIYEDEANFISYLACVQSEDIYFEYSGYLSVLYYLDNDFFAAAGKDRDRYLAEPVILSQVHEDAIFLTQEEWDRIEDKALLDTEVVDAASDAFTDTTLKLNGVSDGMISYSRVVKLLLQYYSFQGYNAR